MYSNHPEVKSVVVERFIRTFEGKICRKMTADDRKTYLCYLDKSVDEHNKPISYHNTITPYCIITVLNDLNQAFP